MNRKILHLVWLTTVLLLVACGEGDGDGSDNDSGVVDVSPGGIYDGTVSSETTGEAFTAMGVVTEGGAARFITAGGLQYVISINVDGTDFSGSLRGYAPPGSEFVNGQSITTGTVSGTIQERGALNGTYEAEGGDVGSFSMSYSAAEYERSSSFAQLEGDWGYQLTNGFAIAVTIESNGSVFGQNSDGCIYNGAVGTIDTRYNVYSLSISASNCGGLNGNYQGLAIRVPQSVSAPESILFGISTTTLSYIDLFDRI